MPLEDRKLVKKQIILISTYPSKIKPNDYHHRSDELIDERKIFDSKGGLENLCQYQKSCNCLCNDGKISKLMCSICLNTRCDRCLKPTALYEHQDLQTETKPKSPENDCCPLCDKNSKKFNDHNPKTDIVTEEESCRDHELVEMKDSATQDSRHSLLWKTSETKDVQTSQTDLGKLDLLKLVLKLGECPCRMSCKPHHSETLTVLNSTKSDAECVERATMKSKSCNLVATTICQLSMGKSVENFHGNESSFTVVDFKRDSGEKSDRNNIEFLLKSKSSSVPFMKIEELKNCLKDKQKAKDTIEEVNRMFANVRKNKSFDLKEDLNRPCTRTGPRVLPVVKSPNYIEENQPMESNNEKKASMEEKGSNATCKKHSGYSHLQNDEHGHRQKTGQESKKCIYTLCCHHKGLDESRRNEVKHGDCRNQRTEALNPCRCKCRNNSGCYPRDSDHSGHTSSTFS